MLNNLKLHSEWALITIDDEPDFLSGKNVAKALQLISDAIQTKYVILHYIEGFGKFGLIHSFKKREHEVILLEDFCQEVLGIIQFDWGDFFLFKEYPQNWDDSEEGYPPLIAQTDTTVRAVDDRYFYIYTIYQEVVDVITKNYEIESIRTDFLSNLDYPY